MRVIAETAGAAGVIHHFAVPTGVHDDGFRILRAFDGNEHTGVVRPAVGVTGKRLHEFGIVVRVVAVFAGITGTLHAGFAV